MGAANGPGCSVHFHLNVDMKQSLSLLLYPPLSQYISGPSEWAPSLPIRAQIDAATHG
ncbi:hypothetical protein TSMEX_002392 [Taenia solium]|eukprot:TsM_000274700 transcript=TsM_000274700 gene=TsM_000274700